MRALFSLAIAGLVVHGAFQAGSAYFVYFEFRDGVQQTAQFGAGRSEQELHARVMTIASDLGVPVAPERVVVRRTQDHTYINADYMASIELLPRYYYPWEFTVDVEAWNLVVPPGSPYAQ